MFYVRIIFFMERLKRVILAKRFIMRPCNQLLFLFLLLFTATSVCAQQSASHVSKNKFKQLSEQYDLLQKDIKGLEQQRLQLEQALKDYDTKLKTFTQGLEVKEHEYDDALPESDADQVLAAS